MTVSAREVKSSLEVRQRTAVRGMPERVFAQHFWESARLEAFVGRSTKEV